MTKQTVEVNCNRLKAFLNDGSETKYTGDKNGNFTAKYLISQYGRILDVHGCPSSGLSFLLLTPSEYEELENWIATMPSNELEIVYNLKENSSEPVELDGETAVMLKTAALMFVYNGYKWYIKNPH